MYRGAPSNKALQSEVHPLDGPCHMDAKRLVVSILPIFLLAACAGDEALSTSHPDALNAPDETSLLEQGPADLVFLGTVISLEPSAVNAPRLWWIVTTKVDQIMSGDFEGSIFQFTVHSPTKSRLEVGRQYEIRAARTAEGYRVDRFQWNR